MYLHKTKNGHYTPPCCYFSGELEVVEILRVGFCCNFTKKRFHGIIILYIIDAMEPFEHNRHIKW